MLNVACIQKDCATIKTTDLLFYWSQIKLTGKNAQKKEERLLMAVGPHLTVNKTHQVYIMLD